jgi:uncharacterized protein DUF3618
MAQGEDFVTGTNTDLGAGRGRSSEEIRSEIDRTRADMDETFAALDYKLTPSQLLLEGWNLFRGGSTAGAGKLWRIAREHPGPAAVIGLGLGWLLVDSSRSEDDRTRRTRYGSGYRGGYEYGEGEYLGYTGSTGYAQTSYAGGYAGTTGYTGEYDTEEGRLSAAKEKVKDAAGTVKHAVADAGHKVGDVAHQARERVSDLGDRTRERASDLRYRASAEASALKGKARYQAQRAKTGFWQMLEENPLMVGAATLALGVIAGLSIPSTRKEDELMGETRDRLVEEVKDLGQETLEKGRHVAEAVADTVKHEAQSQGLTPQSAVGNVVDKVKAVAQEAVNTAKEEARNQNLTAQAAKDRVKESAQHVADTAKADTHEPELANKP